MGHCSQSSTCTPAGNSVVPHRAYGMMLHQECQTFCRLTLDLPAWPFQSIPRGKERLQRNIVQSLLWPLNDCASDIVEESLCDAICCPHLRLGQ